MEYILTNFMLYAVTWSFKNKGKKSEKLSYYFPLLLKLQVTVLYVRRNFQNVAIDLAIHSHSAPIYRLRCISITRKKSYIYMTIVRIFFTFLQRIIHIFIIFYGFYKYWCTTSILPLYLLLSPSRNYLICNLQPLPTTVGGMLGFG